MIFFFKKEDPDNTFCIVWNRTCGCSVCTFMYSCICCIFFSFACYEFWIILQQNNFNLISATKKASEFWSLVFNSILTCTGRFKVQKQSTELCMWNVFVHFYRLILYTGFRDHLKWKVKLNAVIKENTEYQFTWFA